MSRWRSAVASAIGVLAVAGLRAEGLPWEVWATPARLAQLDPADIVLEQSSHCLDGCRFDRSGGDAGPSNPFPLRWLYVDVDEATVFDDVGAGALTRIWMTTGQGTSGCIDSRIRARFYIDGATLPALDMPLAALFDGSTAPFTPPLALDRFGSSGGYVSYVPIAYSQALRIALTGTGTAGGEPCAAGSGVSGHLLWFQFQHHRFAPAAALTRVTAQDAPAWRAFLAHAGDDPWNGMLVPQTSSSLLAPGAAITLLESNGSGWLRGIRVRVPRAAYAELRLRVSIDGVRAVDAPLDLFFATGANADAAARGVLVGEDASQWLYAWFPMPFRKNVTVEVIADPVLQEAILVDSQISVDVATAVPPDAATFVATPIDDCRTGGDFELYAHAGAGKLVGISAHYVAAAGASQVFLEGDEHAYIDGTSAPAWYGTGVEDFYNGGFYFDRLSAPGPLAGVTRVDRMAPFETAAYRLMLTDPMVYTSGLRLTQEVGASAAEPGSACVRGIAYAYRVERPLTVGYADFEVASEAATAVHAYVVPQEARCALLDAQFEDDAGTSRSARVCRYGEGSSRFRFHLSVDSGVPLRLRRTFDAGGGTPGMRAGSAAAIVRVNGRIAATFPVATSNPVRRWQQQEAVLDMDGAPAEVEIEIAPVFSVTAPEFTESTWELRGAWKDGILHDGFDAQAIDSAAEVTARSFAAPSGTRR